MERIKSMGEFVKSVCRCVKENLPPELKSTDVCATYLDTGEGGMRMLLLVMRPWNHITTGFYLDSWYQDYAAGSATVESVSAAILNDSRLYRMPIG